MNNDHTEHSRILVAEDDPVSRRLIESRLRKWGYEVVTTDSGEEALKVLLSDSGPRLAVLDWMMPGLDGPEVCRRLRSTRQEPYTYVILLTARTDREDLVRGMDAGADDYMSKPFNPNELEVRLRAGQRILTLQRDLIRAREVLLYQATHDALTGLWNRGAILDLLDHELARSKRDKRSLGVALIDLDYFKRVNDSFGHHVGDDVLRRSAEQMKASVRPYDEVGRYGGEEFLMMIPNNEADTARVIAERVRERIATMNVADAGCTMQPTVSVGLAIGDPQCLPTVDVIIQQADRALYQAKANGRNRVEVADPPPAKSPLASRQGDV